MKFLKSKIGLKLLLSGVLLLALSCCNKQNESELESAQNSETNSDAETLSPPALARLQPLSQSEELKLGKSSQIPGYYYVNYLDTEDLEERSRITSPPTGDYPANWRSVPWYESSPSDGDNFSFEELENIQNRSGRFHLREEQTDQNHELLKTKR